MSNTTPGGEPEEHRPDDSVVAGDEPNAADETIIVERLDDGDATRETIVTNGGEHDPGDDLATDRSSDAELDAAVERANAAARDANEPSVEPSAEPATAAYQPPASDPSYQPPATEYGYQQPASENGFGAPAQQAIYVQAPEPPATKGNRGFGVLVGLAGAVAFALLFAGVSYLLLLAQGSVAESADAFTQFLMRPVFWIPVLAFFIGFSILAAIVNRGGWWAYVIFGLVVGVFVYFSYIGGALLTVQAWTLTVDEAVSFIGQRWLDPLAILAGVIAREVTVWFGAWVARRGRTVTERNREAQEEYDRQLAAGPRVSR